MVPWVRGLSLPARAFSLAGGALGLAAVGKSFAPSQCAAKPGAPELGEVVGALERIEERLTDIEQRIGQSEASQEARLRLYPELVKLLRAPEPGKVGKRIRPDRTQVVRIVLTGGPCGGKSSALKRIALCCTAAGFDVYVAPEAATVFFTGGALWQPDEEFRFVFQSGILELQLQLERSFTNVASATARPSILILDRGLLDGKAFVDDETWRRMLHVVDATDVSEVTEDYCMSRYDGVIHMITAADGAESFYRHGWTTDDSGKEVFRRETPADAVEQDRKLRACWEPHPGYLVFDNERSFEDKVQAVADAVLEIANRTHPQS